MTPTLTPNRAADRLRRAADEATRLGYEALLLAPSPDLRYLCGYEPMPLERLTMLLLAADREPTMIVPELEAPLAAASPAGGVMTLAPWRDGVDPYALTASLLPRAGRVAVGDRLWATHLLGLQAASPGLSFSPAADVMAGLRAKKDPDELDALRRAGAAADRTFADVIAMSFAGRRELDVAADLADLLVAHGHDRADFTIVASGPNAASPHHEPGERTIAEGELVVLDFGGALDGYFSDTTRTVAVGEVSAEAREVHEVVRRAQAAACDAVRPGAAAQDVDRAARRVIEEAGYGDRFIHRTGHGIGLEVHEPPYVIEGNELVLAPGMTFSVEPGVYLEGRLGVRIEDIVAVTDDGVERLNTSPRELRTVA
jgi:D-alanyl-D-alanine dipeptidase